MNKYLCIYLCVHMHTHFFNFIFALCKYVMGRAREKLSPLLRIKDAVTLL
jgi:hypothetical protein